MSVFWLYAFKKMYHSNTYGTSNISKRHVKKLFENQLQFIQIRIWWILKVYNQNKF